MVTHREEEEGDGAGWTCFCNRESHTCKENNSLQTYLAGLIQLSQYKRCRGSNIAYTVIMCPRIKTSTTHTVCSCMVKREDPASRWELPVLASISRLNSVHILRAGDEGI